MKHISRNNQGFTLIELMIVVAIVAILAGVAYPSYQQYVRRTAIADAQMSLNGLAQAMERFRAQTGTYEGAANGGADTGAPAIFRTQSPESGSAQFNLTIDAATATTYTVEATSTAGAVEANATLTTDELGNIGGTLASEVSH